MLLPDQVDDFVNLTVENFKRRRWTDLSLEHPEYIASSVINERSVEEQGSYQVNFKLKTKNTGTAKNTGLMAIDETNIDDKTIAATVPWAYQTVNWSYDIDFDVFQSDEETIVRWLVLEEHAALSDMAELNEENMWSAPTSSSDRRPMGIPFWMQKDATTTPEGAFNGGNPAGWSGGAAGVDSNEYVRWRNWTFGYSAPTVEDLVRKVKIAMVRTHFMPPVDYPELKYPSGRMPNCIYTTYRVQEPLERLAESRNDNLGGDLAKYRGKTTIGGVPIKWVPYLDANDTSDPLYGVNWETIRPFVRKGRNMRRSKPIQAPRQHTVRNVFIDNAQQYCCYNRRRLWVGSKA